MPRKRNCRHRRSRRRDYDGDHERDHPRRLYRDTEHRVFAGVCAGIADYFGFGRCAVRTIAVLMLFFWFPFTFFAYLALWLLLPKKPAKLYRDEDEEVFWRSVRRSPEATFSNVRHKFRELEVKLQRMESYVTSSRFKLDREFENLRD